VRYILSGSIVTNVNTFTVNSRQASAYMQQERFMRFLYKLSSAHYNWGRKVSVFVYMRQTRLKNNINCIFLNLFQNYRRKNYPERREGRKYSKEDKGI